MVVCFCYAEDVFNTSSTRLHQNKCLLGRASFTFEYVARAGLSLSHPSQNSRGNCISDFMEKGSSCEFTKNTLQHHLCRENFRRS